MKKGTMVALAIGGFILIFAGFGIMKLSQNAQGAMAALPYVFVGVGSGVFGHGMGELTREWTVKNRPELKKQQEIEKNDERNIEISNRAKGRAYDATVYIFGALMVSLSLMDVNMYVLLMLVFAYLLVIGIFIYYCRKYDREM